MYGPNGEELKTRRRPEDLAQGGFNWRQFSPAAEPASGPPLDPDTSRLLDDAATDVIRGGAPGRRLNRVELDLAAGIPFCQHDRQQPMLSFSAPVIQGDIAFVETSYVCGGLCGTGYIYALRRGTDGRWAIIGEMLISFS